MGQYYLTVNTTKRQYLDPHRMGQGLKLLEFGCDSEGVMTGLAILLASGNGRGGGDLGGDHPIIGSWASDRIVVAGDYADVGKHVPRAVLREFRERTKSPAFAEEYGTKPTLYRVARALFTDISDDVLVAMCGDSYLRSSLKDRFTGQFAFGAKRELSEGKRPALATALGLTDKDLRALRD